MKSNFFIKVRVGFAISVLATIIFYVAGSLASASFNVTEWTKITREIIAFFTYLCTKTINNSILIILYNKYYFRNLYIKHGQKCEFDFFKGVKHWF